MKKQLKELIAKTQGRADTFEFALKLSEERGIKNIIECGTSRIPDNFEGDGLATLLFGEYCKEHDIKMHTVDKNRIAISEAKIITKDYEDYITYVCSDSVEFLKKFRGQIDFLYLDSLDCYKHQIQEAQEHNLNEFKSSEPMLTENSIILIDDYSSEGKGKCMKTMAYMKEKGYKFYVGERQVVSYKSKEEK